MYLISAYFDDNTTSILQHTIDEVARVTGNDFMIKNDVVPHMTVSAFEQTSDDRAVVLFEEIEDRFSYEEIIVPSIGVFMPYVIFAEAVVNEYLLSMSESVYEVLNRHEDTRINKYYRPYSWIPHITIGKTLDKEQMRKAFEILQDRFRPLNASVTAFGLSKPNPMRDIAVDYKN